MCVFGSEWAAISLAAEKLKQGAYFLSTSHVLQSALFEVVKSYNFKMSWGTATLFIHVRLIVRGRVCCCEEETATRCAARCAIDRIQTLNSWVYDTQRRRKIGRWAAQMLRGGRATRTDLLEQQQQKLQKAEATGVPKNDELRE